MVCKSERNGWNYMYNRIYRDFRENQLIFFLHDSEKEMMKTANKSDG